MSVQLSTSRLRTAPGMGDHTGCFVCGEPGHWSKDCHLGQNGGFGGGPGVRGGGFGFRGGRGFPRGAPGFARGGPGFPGGPGIPRGLAPGPYGGSSFGARVGYAGEMPALPSSRRPGFSPFGSEPAPSPYGGSAYESERYGGGGGGVDFYEKYRARPQAASGYGEDRHLPSAYSSLPTSSSAISRERLPPSSLASYERRPLPASAVSGSSYYSRERSPVRRVSASGDGVLYERSRLSPGSSVSRSSTYDMPQARDPYSNRVRYAY